MFYSFHYSCERISCQHVQQARCMFKSSNFPFAWEKTARPLFIKSFSFHENRDFSIKILLKEPKMQNKNCINDSQGPSVIRIPFCGALSFNVFVQVALHVLGFFYLESHSSNRCIKDEDQSWENQSAIDHFCFEWSLFENSEIFPLIRELNNSLTIHCTKVKGSRRKMISVGR